MCAPVERQNRAHFGHQRVQENTILTKLEEKNSEGNLNKQTKNKKKIKKKKRKQKNIKKKKKKKRKKEK